MLVSAGHAATVTVIWLRLVPVRLGKPHGARAAAKTLGARAGATSVACTDRRLVLGIYRKRRLRPISSFENIMTANRHGG